MYICFRGTFELTKSIRPREIYLHFSPITYNIVDASIQLSPSTAMPFNDGSNFQFVTS